MEVEIKLHLDVWETVVNALNEKYLNASTEKERYEAEFAYTYIAQTLAAHGIQFSSE